ncbi:MAG: zinc ribbon domain-containing protein [Acidobacteriota bacterium]
MHCPRCGQQQISDQTNFCSRCGFQLGLVVELLENGGYLPQLAEIQQGKGTSFTRKNGVIFSVLWLIFWMMLLPAFFGALGANRIPGALAAFGFFSSLILLVASLALLKRAPKAYELGTQPIKPSSATSLYGGMPVGALPTPNTRPASAYMPPEGAWKAADTGDLVRPGSVIESTTKLLKKDE